MLSNMYRNSFHMAHRTHRNRHRIPWNSSRHISHLGLQSSNRISWVYSLMSIASIDQMRHSGCKEEFNRNTFYKLNLAHRRIMLVNNYWLIYCTSSLMYIQNSILCMCYLTGRSSSNRLMKGLFSCNTRRLMNLIIECLSHKARMFRARLRMGSNTLNKLSRLNILCKMVVRNYSLMQEYVLWWFWE